MDDIKKFNDPLTEYDNPYKLWRLLIDFLYSYQSVDESTEHLERIMRARFPGAYRIVWSTRYNEMPFVFDDEKEEMMWKLKYGTEPTL